MARRRPKRGLVWWLVFIVAFALTSYLMRDKPERLDPARALAKHQDTEDSRLSEHSHDSSEESGVSEGSDAEAGGSIEIPFLAELNQDRWQSPAGLVYSRVDASQHRLSLLSAHIREPTDLECQRGFDGDLHQVLVWIDQAYRRFQQGNSGDRANAISNGESVIQIELPEVIGWVRRPNSVDVDSTSWLRLILHDYEVIDAYPVVIPSPSTGAPQN